MSRQHRKRRSGYEILLIPKDGHAARRWSVPKALLLSGSALLLLAFGVFVGAVVLSTNLHARLDARTAELDALTNRHITLQAEAAEQEERLLLLAQEAEGLSVRVRELEGLGDEIMHLLGREDVPDGLSGTFEPGAPSAATAMAHPADDSLGRGGPAEADGRRLADYALNVVDAVAHVLPETEAELQTLRQSVLARNHRLAHTPSVWPVSGRVSSEFGSRRHPISGNVQLHRGIDIAAPTGTPVHAPAAGTVVFAGDRGGYGLTVIVDHGYDVRTLYAHNSRLHVRAGEQVEQGTLLSSVGSTGQSTGPHLHYEVHLRGEAVNPRSYLP